METGLAFFLLYPLVFFAVAGYLLIFSSFGRLSKYFADNARPSLRASFYLTIEYGLKNFLLALVHTILRSSNLYAWQFGSLGAIELLCIINNLMFLRDVKLYEYRFKIWLMVTFSFIRVMLLTVLLFQQSN